MGNSEIRKFNEPIAESGYRIAGWKRLTQGTEKKQKKRYALCAMLFAE